MRGFLGRSWKTWGCLIEYKLCWFPNLLTKRWFFRSVGWGQRLSRWDWLHNLKDRVSTRFAQGYYGSGRWWEAFKEPGSEWEMDKETREPNTP